MAGQPGIEAPALLEAAINRLHDMGTDLTTIANDAALPLDDVRALVVESGDHRPKVDL